jgi:unsaturated chondroitin disaccharide hydrolase
MPAADRIAKYEAALTFAQRQVQALIERSPDFFPIYTTGGRWHHAGERWTDWTGGFLVGMMWQFHRRTGERAWRERAEHYARLLEHRQHDTEVHDLGFVFLNAYRPWYELTGDRQLLQVIIQAGRTLAQRYQPKGRYLCSFIGPHSLFIDIMMNVPLIQYAANETLDADLARVAVAHCRTTRDCLVRIDGSVAHEGIFDTQTGKFLCQSTHQGLHAESAWARGLAWSLYGYSQMYGLCQAEEFREVAQRNAQYWIDHLPVDHVPWWDFHADLTLPPPRGAQKESSAAAIAASGLLDLARHAASPVLAQQYRAVACNMLDALVDPAYLAMTTPGWEGILKHGVYHTEKGLGVDESVMWGEYFFVEALTRVVLEPWESQDS